MANSIANLTYNIFGFLPAPVIMGVIINSGDGENYKTGWTVLMYYSILPIVSFLVGTYFIFRDDIFKFAEQEERQKQEALNKESDE